MTTILPRRGTAAQWTSANPVLAMGELGYETDTKKWKRGDGVTAWTSLAYYQPAWDDVTAKPAVIAAGADQAAARAAIGAVDAAVVDILATVATTAKFPGIDPTGATNSRLGLIDAVNATPTGGELIIPAGTYQLGGSSVAITDRSIRISAYGAKFIGTGAPFRFLASAETIYNVSSVSVTQIVNESTTQPALSLTLASGTPPWVRGDVIRLIADDILPGARPGDGTNESRFGQCHVVESVSGSTVVVTGELRDQCTTNVRVSRIPNYVMQFRGGIFDVGYPFECRNLLYPVIEDVRIIKTTTQAFKFLGCYGYTANRLQVDAAPDIPSSSLYGYGVYDTSGSFGVINQSHISRVRHAYTDDTGRIPANSVDIWLYGRTYGIKVTNGVAVGTTNESWDTHSSSERVEFLDCDSIDSALGVGLRGRNHKFRGRIINPRGTAIKLFAEPGTDTESHGHDVDADVVWRDSVNKSDSPVFVGLNTVSGVRETRLSKLRVRIKSDGVVPVALKTRNCTIDVDVSVTSGSTIVSATRELVNTTILSQQPPVDMWMRTSDSFSGADTTDINTKPLDAAFGSSESLSWTCSPTTRWGITSGKLVHGASNGVGLLTVPYTSADVDISVKVYSTATTADGVTIEARLDTNSGTATATSYVVSFGAGVAQLGIKVATSTATLLGSPMSYVAGDRIGLRVSGSTVTLLINDIAVNSVTDTTIASGSFVGIKKKSAMEIGELDDVWIRSIGIRE